MRGSPRAHGRRPAHQWLGMVLNPANATTTAGAGVTVFKLFQFESPTITVGTALTADPPEDQILDRLIWTGSLTNAGAAGRSQIGFILVDATWTPQGTTAITPDLDKRWLWWRDYQFENTGDFVNQHQMLIGTSHLSNAMMAETNPTFMDISPKVKLEDGKALCLVTYQDTALQTTAYSGFLRILMHRAGRR